MDIVQTLKVITEVEEVWRREAETTQAAFKVYKEAQLQEDIRMKEVIEDIRDKNVRAAEDVIPRTTRKQMLSGLSGVIPRTTRNLTIKPRRKFLLHGTWLRSSLRVTAGDNSKNLSHFIWRKRKGFLPRPG